MLSTDIEFNSDDGKILSEDMLSLTSTRMALLSSIKNKNLYISDGKILVKKEKA